MLKQRKEARSEKQKAKLEEERKEKPHQEEIRLEKIKSEEEQAEAGARAEAQAKAEQEAAAQAQADQTKLREVPSHVNEPQTNKSFVSTSQPPEYNIPGYSSVLLDTSQDTLNQSCGNWISISDIPTSGGIALLGHANAAGIWVGGSNVGDIIIVSGVRYQIYNKYIVGWNSQGEWDAIETCASNELSVITCTDASGQTY